MLCVVVCSVAAAQTPRHLACTLAQEQGQRQEWAEQTGGVWMERSSDGRSTKFTVIDQKTVLHGVRGVTVIDPGRLKVFVPDAGVTGPYAKVLYFIDLTGDTGEWQVLGIFTEQP